MATLYITVGLPGSGKTTEARRMLNTSPLGSLARINRDDLRRMALPDGYRVPVKQAEERITAIRDAAVTALLRAGCDVVCDDTNLRPEYVQQLAALARKARATVRILNFTGVPEDVCIERDAARAEQDRVGADVIRRMRRGIGESA